MIQSWVVCQTSYEYSLLKRANKLETAVPTEYYAYMYNVCTHNDAFI